MIDWLLIGVNVTTLPEVSDDPPLVTAIAMEYLQKLYFVALATMLMSFVELLSP